MEFVFIFFPSFSFNWLFGAGDNSVGKFTCCAALSCSHGERGGGGGALAAESNRLPSVFCSSAHHLDAPFISFFLFSFFQSAFLILPEVSRLTCAAHMQPMHICPTQLNRGGQASAQGHSVAQGRTFKNSRVCVSVPCKPTI